MVNYAGKTPVYKPKLAKLLVKGHSYYWDLIKRLYPEYDSDEVDSRRALCRLRSAVHRLRKEGWDIIPRRRTGQYTLIKKGQSWETYRTM